MIYSLSIHIYILADIADIRIQINLNLIALKIQL